MEGIRFYRDLSSNTGKNAFRKACSKQGIKPAHCTDLGSVVARYLGNDHWSLGIYVCEATAGVMDYEDSPVGSTSVALDYLRESCIWIPESVARTVHPELFRFLDQA